MRCTLHLALLVLAFQGAVQTSQAAATKEPVAACSTKLTAKIPARRPDALGGAAFGRLIAGKSHAQRAQAVKQQFLAGNVPNFLRQLKPVPLTAPGEQGRVAWICVMPDYLAIGSDNDNLRMPMGRTTAATVARAYGFVLPTRKMVDAIYRASEVRLAPKPLPPGPQMSSLAYYGDHQRRIEAQRPRLAHVALMAGHKKDLVLTDRLRTRPGRVAIYGWHRRDGKPIQPLSTVHGAQYADYSHGVRLVSGLVWVDGRWRSVYDALGNRRMAELLTVEGTISRAREIMGVRK